MRHRTTIRARSVFGLALSCLLSKFDAPHVKKWIQGKGGKRSIQSRVWAHRPLSRFYLLVIFPHDASATG